MNVVFFVRDTFDERGEAGVVRDFGVGRFFEEQVTAALPQGIVKMGGLEIGQECIIADDGTNTVLDGA